MVNVTTLTRDEAAQCPIRRVLSKVTDKWQLLILFVSGDGALRVGALSRNIGDVTQRVVTETLRGLERDGYLARTVRDGAPVAVSYDLTDRG